MNTETSSFVLGGNEITPRRKKLLKLRAGMGGYPIYPGIGSYGSPVGNVTGVGNPPMNPDQFGGSGDGDHDADDNPNSGLGSGDAGAGGDSGSGGGSGAP